jgi:chromosome segregation ATPase
MTDDLDKRLDAALDRRTKLEAKKERISGQLEAAEEALAAVDAECREKGREPEELDDTIAKLKTKYTEMVENLEREVEEADAALAPYTVEEA